jgi:hypothetical protein
MQPVYPFFFYLMQVLVRTRFIVELIINMLIYCTQIYILLRDTHADCYKILLDLIKLGDTP